MAADREAADGYVRIEIAALPTIQLHHLASDVDMSIAVAEEIEAAAQGKIVTGFTEWAGSWQNAQISLGWDWAGLGDRIVVINPAEIRTNVRLVTRNGQVAPAERARADLLQWIELHPWRVGTISDLIAGEFGEAP